VLDKNVWIVRIKSGKLAVNWQLAGLMQ
jgi:hypothetical protein